jgi:hypothetical protein
MKRILLVSIVFTVMVNSQVSAQTYYLNIQGGAGYARFITDMNQSGLNQDGYVTSFRIMWEPEHLLRIGLESGYNSLYTYGESGIETEFGTTDAKSSLSSIPILFVISMQITPTINILTGLGPSILKTSFDAFGLETQSSQISTSYIVATSYNQPLSKKLSLGAEFRWYHVQKIEDGTLSLQLTVGYKILAW